MKKILLITTGGTIASQQTEHGLIPSMTSEQLLSYLPEMDNEIVLDSRAVCNIDSTDMTAEQWLLIARAIRESYDDYDGFVVAHGTDTMAYTAAALSYLIQESPKPIVFTGAQKPIGSEITDAKTNLRDSILYAADDDSSDVVIVFGGQVIAGTRAKKTKTYSFAAFTSINYPELATIRDGQIVRYITKEKGTGPVFYDNLNTDVFLIKLTPGMSPDILEAILRKNQAIIIESFGVGGLPQSLVEDFLGLMEEPAQKDKLIVMGTQVTYEGSNIEVYEVGRRIKEKLPVLESKDMTHEAVLTKLMWILGMDPMPDRSTVDELFYKKVNYDTIF